MDADLRALLTETVTVYPWASDTAYGSPQYGTGTAYPARLERRSRLVVNREGKQVVATTTVFLGPSDAGTLPGSFDPRDRLVWSASTGEALSVLAMESVADEAGAFHHVACYCG